MSISNLLDRLIKENRLTFIKLATAIAIVITAVSMVIIFVAARIVRERSIHDLASQDAKQISRFIFESLYSGMVNGWTKKELEGAIRRLNRVEPGMRIKVFRGTPVIKDFGEVEGERQEREQPNIRDAMKGRESLVRAAGLTYYYPVVAERKCLSCHRTMKEGDVAGVIVVSYPIQNLKVSLNFLINTGLIFFTIFIVFAYALFYFSIRVLLVRPILSLVDAIKDAIPEANRNKSLSVRSYIAEILQLTTYFNKLLFTIYEYYQKLEELAIRDPLTKLYNRRKFEEVLEYEAYRSKRYGHRFCLIALDLDFFKHINDSYGHPIGDIVLREAASLLMRSLRKSDLIARVGGDEFSIVLSETPLEGGVNLAEKLRRIMSETPFGVMIGNIGVQASFGVAEYPTNGETAHDLITAADVALYRAKRQGRNCVVAIDVLETDALGVKMDMVKRGEMLRSALQQERVEPFFQPIVEIATGEIFGFNVLARVKEGDAHLLASQFISTAEELGYLDMIDAIVFERALGLFDRLAAKHGGTLKLFFNTSQKRLFSDGLLDEVEGLLQKYSVPSEAIVFQIAENETLPNITNFMELSRKMKEFGITFALKNFGSGFSSFTYLKYLDVAYVKIYGDFIKNIDSEMRNHIFVANIHQILCQLNITGIAECVEDRESNEALKEIGVRLGQGYYYGRPEEVE